MKLIRVTANVIKYLQELRRRTGRPPLTMLNHPITRAENLWIQYEQRRWYSEEFDNLKKGKRSNLIAKLGLQLDDKNILRCVQCLQYLDFLTFQIEKNFRNCCQGLIVRTSQDWSSCITMNHSCTNAQTRHFFLSGVNSGCLQDVQLCRQLCGEVSSAIALHLDPLSNRRTQPYHLLGFNPPCIHSSISDWIHVGRF